MNSRQLSHKKAERGRSDIDNASEFAVAEWPSGLNSQSKIRQSAATGSLRSSIHNLFFGWVVLW